jgi:O-antigen ligase/tetratricopeptide (TPR) repeat protein
MTENPPHSIFGHALRGGQGAMPPWLLLLGGIVVFSPLLEGGTTHAAVMVIRLMILLLAAGCLRSAIQARRLVVPAPAILAAVAAFLALAALSTAFSPYRHQSLQWLIVLLGYAAFLYVLLCVFETWGHVAWILAVLVLTGLFEAGLALVQAWGLHAPRPSGTFANPNFLAGYLAAVWCVLLGHLSHLRIGRGGWRTRLASLQAALPAVAAALVLLAVALTRSRGGLLALAGGTAVAVLLRFGRKGLIGVAVFLAIVLSVPNPLSERIRVEHSLNPVGYARLQMWERAAQEIREHPLGLGLGLYQYVYPRNAVPIEKQVARYGRVAQTAHSEYVQIGVELGVPALAVFCWGLVLMFREMRAALACRLRRWQRGLVAGAGGAWASILAHAAVDSNLHEPAIVVVLALCTAILLSARRFAQPALAGRTILIRRPVAWGACSVVVLALAAMLVARLGVAWLAFEAGAKALAGRNVERAIEYYGQAIELDPGKALYHNSKAAAHLQRFQQTREPAELAVVVEELKRESALNPLSARPFKLLGDVYGSAASDAGAPDRRQPWLRLARESYEQAIAREPFNPFHRLEAGRYALALADAGTAEQTVREAVEMEPNFLPGRAWLVARYAATGRTGPAKQEYEEILQRQRYYSSWTLEAYEKSFLHVDTRELAALLERSRGGGKSPQHRVS